MGRMGEINRLTWSDVNLEERYVVLYTRKKRGGHLTPRKVPMTQKVFEILSRHYEKRAKDKPWVFWQQYWDKKKKSSAEGPYQDRKRIMKPLCQNAKVRYFRFHALRGIAYSANLSKSANSVKRIFSLPKSQIYNASIWRDTICWGYLGITKSEGSVPTS